MCCAHCVEATALRLSVYLFSFTHRIKVEAKNNATITSAQEKTEYFIVYSSLLRCSAVQVHVLYKIQLLGLILSSLYPYPYIFIQVCLNEDFLQT